MKRTWLQWDMPITLEMVDKDADVKYFKLIFDYFDYIDKKFSPFIYTSEISKFNRGDIAPEDLSEDMKTVFDLAMKAKAQTGGYFDVYHNKKYDLLGIVKGWAILQAANKLLEKKLQNFYIEAGGDIQAYGKNADGRLWTVGIQNPFIRSQNVKILMIENQGVATSGTAIRGQHIYNPFRTNEAILDIISMSVIGPDIYQADLIATASFAMGREGINFIQDLEGFEGYMIDKGGIATMTTGFGNFVI